MGQYPRFCHGALSLHLTDVNFEPLVTAFSHKDNRLLNNEGAKLSTIKLSVLFIQTLGN